MADIAVKRKASGRITNEDEEGHCEIGNWVKEEAEDAVVKGHGCIGGSADRSRTRLSLRTRSEEITKHRQRC
jgi:hypothetical protein